MLVAHQVRQSLMCLANAFSNAHLSEQNPDRQGVDEDTQGPIRALSALHATEQHRAEYHILATRAATHHLGPRPVKHTSRADSKHSSLFADASTEVRLQPLMHFLYRPPIPVHLQQPERCGRLLHVRQHLMEERDMLLPRDPEAGLRHEVPERYGRGYFSFQTSLNQRDLLQDHFQRSMVGRQMMAYQAQQPAPVYGIEGHKTLQQRRLPEIQAVVIGVYARLELR